MNTTGNPTTDPSGRPTAGRARSKTTRYLLTAALLTGGVTVGAFLSPIGLAGADDSGTPSTETSALGSEIDEGGYGHRDHDHLRGQPGEWRDGDGGHRLGHHRGGQHQVRAGLRDVAAELGLSVEQLRESMAGGSTLAEAAGEQGVSGDELVAALLSEAERRIDDAVESGKLDADRAAEMKDDLEERISAFVGREPGEGPGFVHDHGHIHGHSHPHRHRGPGAGSDGPADP